MKRNLEEKRFNDYQNSIVIRKIHPIFWCQCKKCGMEFRREDGYRADIPITALSCTHSYYGCKDCFQSVNNFTEYLKETGRIITDIKEIT